MQLHWPIWRRQSGSSKRQLPGWWYTLGICSVSRDASCGPDIAGPDATLAQQVRKFDAGFHCDDHHPDSTMAGALRNVMTQALEAKARLREKGSVADDPEAVVMRDLEAERAIAATPEAIAMGDSVLQALTDDWNCLDRHGLDQRREAQFAKSPSARFSSSHTCLRSGLKNVLLVVWRPPTFNSGVQGAVRQSVEPTRPLDRAIVGRSTSRSRRFPFPAIAPEGDRGRVVQQSHSPPLRQSKIACVGASHESFCRSAFLHITLDDVERVGQVYGGTFVPPRPPCVPN